jgi:hypothetical protein
MDWKKARIKRFGLFTQDRENCIVFGICPSPLSRQKFAMPFCKPCFCLGSDCYDIYPVYSMYNGWEQKVLYNANIDYLSSNSLYSHFLHTFKNPSKCIVWYNLRVFTEVCFCYLKKYQRPTFFKSSHKIKIFLNETEQLPKMQRVCCFEQLKMPQRIIKSSQKPRRKKNFSPKFLFGTLLAAV